MVISDVINEIDYRVFSESELIFIISQFLKNTQRRTFKHIDSQEFHNLYTDVQFLIKKYSN